MVKILSGETTWSQEITCRDCHAKLSIFQEDLMVRHSKEFGDDSVEDEDGTSFDIYVICPLCKTENNVGNSIPEGMRNYMMGLIHQ